ncbi:hypothetical protein C8J56DRAFT_885699 [Mycena floridula]|nr:hypothetical protein C8J56DRAFT_885699 [Mycena floridula]
MRAATSCSLWLILALLFCLSSGTPVPTRGSLLTRETHLLLPRKMGGLIDQGSNVKAGTPVWIPTAGVEGPKVNQQVGKRTCHLAIILGEPVNGLYPIAYISHDAAYTEALPFQIHGINEEGYSSGKLKLGAKQSALQVNMYQATDIERLVTPEEVEKLKKSLRNGESLPSTSVAGPSNKAATTSEAGPSTKGVITGATKGATTTTPMSKAASKKRL